MTRMILLLPMLFGGCLYVTVDADQAAPSQSETLSRAGAIVDELFLPAERASPTTGRASLTVGRPYEVTLDGTYSAWSAQQWRSVCAGRAEPSPRYVSEGQTGPVGLDPLYLFAIPSRSWGCGLSVPTRRSALYFRLTRLGDWRAGATNAPYNSDHIYTFRVVGEGAPFTAYIYDSPGQHVDNYGRLRVVIRDVGR